MQTVGQQQAILKQSIGLRIYHSSTWVLCEHAVSSRLSAILPCSYGLPSSHFCQASEDVLMLGLSALSECGSGSSTAPGEEGS